ncbi:hypothetical protein Dimus_012132 [Dionaea muscipula]
MIPIKHLLKMGVHTIEIDGVPLKVSVADCAAVIDWHVNDMKIIAARSNPSVVGLDLKSRLRAYTNTNLPVYNYQFLVLCVGDRCLIVYLDHLDCFPDSLIGFLNDESVCHVGVAINEGNCRMLKHKLLSSQSLTKAGVDVGELVARVLGKSCLLTSPITLLAREAGVNIGKQEDFMDGTKAASKFYAKFLSSAEVKDLAKDAFRCYKIGHKLLSSL